MKKIYLGAAIILISLIASSQVCENRVGNFIYKSSTVIGTTTIIVYPSLITAEGKFAVIDGIYSKDRDSICQAYGLSNLVGNIQLDNYKDDIQVVRITSDGVYLEKGGMPIKSISCKH